LAAHLPAQFASTVIALGTLVANLLGGYLIGVAVAFFANIHRFRLNGACWS